MNWMQFNSDTPVLIQGMTGKEGQRMCSWLLECGINVVAGVTPGKGGQTVLGKPIFDSVSDARKQFSDLTASSIVVPPSRVKSAAEEALRAGIRFLHIFTEHVPVHDVLFIKKMAVDSGAILLGPSSVGFLQFPKFRLGYIGGERPFERLKEGGMAVISTSGGMTNELMMALAAHGVGIRLAMAVGGDKVVGTSLDEAIRLCESLPEVKTIAVFVEPGRIFLRDLANGSRVLVKPTVVFLAGESLDEFPRGIPFGHTGTILGEGDQNVQHLRACLKNKMVNCVSTLSEFVYQCERICQNNS